MTPRDVYKSNLRDIRFALWEQFRFGDALDQLSHNAIDRSMIDFLLEQANLFAHRELGPFYQQADREGCRLSAHRNEVKIPTAFPELWKKYREAGWNRLAAPLDESGIRLPFLPIHASLEMLFGANPAFMMYSGFGVPISFLIDTYGDDFLKQVFSERLLVADWCGSFCMTEPDAGSDVGAIRTMAHRQEDGTYHIEGEKIFITAGMHDLADNMIYLVVARTPGATGGTLGLSCFIVPRFSVDAQGEITGDNHVDCSRIENKMGLHGCATVGLVFGQRGPCTGYLLGDKENIGLNQISSLMSLARVSTGVFALGMASSAYLNAAHYATQRVQGVNIRQSFNPRARRVPIIEHLDVRRMLLEMKSKTEGCRALLLKLSYHFSMQRMIAAGEIAVNDAEAQRHEGYSKLLTPLVKAYISDQSWRIAELAIQVHGGHGYIKDNPVEQYARDCKILSIWEGTNFMQSADLIRDKLAMGKESVLLKMFAGDIRSFCEKLADSHPFAVEKHALLSALVALETAHATFGKWAREHKLDLIFSVSTRFLEMMAETTLAWLLLEAAVIANRALEQSDADAALAENSLADSEKNFYQGKIQSMKFFIRNVLPSVMTKAAIIHLEDDTVKLAGAETFIDLSA